MTTQEQGSGGPVIAMLERKTSLVILAIGAMATIVVYAIETLTEANTTLDRWVQPILALALFCLFLRLRRRPETLVTTQRWGVACLQIYFVSGVVHLSVLAPQQITIYWMATTYMWTVLITLVLHMTWPQRAALMWSVSLAGVVSIPPLIARLHVPAARWDTEFAPLMLNGLLVELAMLMSLMSVSRLRHGVMQVLATGGPVGPADARKALERWLHEKTNTLAEARDSAEAASRAKSQFLAVMSHELRTPLHAMLVSADLLAEKDEPGRSDPATAAERNARLVSTIQSSGKHLLALIDQVLDLSRIEAGKVVMVHEPMDLVTACRRATEAVSPMTQRKGLTLRLNVASDLVLQRRGDTLRLSQVLINLLANAAKFTEHGGIRLDVSRVDDERVRFEVIDTGPGLSEEAQQRVFDAFYQVDHDSTRRNGGVGLGLTITQELVTLAGGTLSLQSRLGHGTTVRVDLPLPPTQDVTPSVVPIPLRPDHLAGTRVLVVEDDPVNSMLACEVLCGVRADAQAVESGEAALLYLREHPVDIVLMDFRMPGMDGLEATCRIRQGEAGPEAVDVPVLGLTANAHAEDREQCLAAGMSEVLTKPIERRQLIQAVEQWQRPPRAQAPRLKTAS
ncbi:MAG TPA: response regulator [Candidatus Aquabacterium excrementipullorum]|nr:response regulator [Candidatus Aquabacterium excrementipullorum]